MIEDNTFLKILKSIIGTIIGLIATEKFNIFSYMTFVSEQECFNICITLYIVLAEYLVEWVFDKVKMLSGLFFSSVEVTLFLPDTERDINYNPTILFNSEDSAMIIVLVKLKGKNKHLDGCELIINKTDVIDFQPNCKNNKVCCDKGDYHIKLHELFGNTETKTTICQTFKLILSQAIVDFDAYEEIRPVLYCNTKNVFFTSNHITVKVGNNK